MALCTKRGDAADAVSKVQHRCRVFIYPTAEALDSIAGESRGGGTEAGGQVRLLRVESVACGVVRGADPPAVVDVNANIEERLTGQEGIMVTVRNESDTDRSKDGCKNSVENGVGEVECSVIGIAFVPNWCTEECQGTGVENRYSLAFVKPEDQRAQLTTERPPHRDAMLSNVHRTIAVGVVVG